MSEDQRGEEKLADIQGFVRLVDFLQKKKQVTGHLTRKHIAIERYQAQRDLFSSGPTPHVHEEGSPAEVQSDELSAEPVS